MNIINRLFGKNKKPRKISDIVAELKLIAESNSKLTIVFMSTDTEYKSTMIQGTESSVKSLMSDACANDETFNSIIQETAKSSKNTSNELFDEEEIALDLLKNNKNFKSIDLPDGGRVMAIDVSNIDDISDEDVDDIINDMFRDLDGKNTDSPEE